MELRRSAARAQLQETRETLKRLREDSVIAQEATSDARIHAINAQAKLDTAHAASSSAEETYKMSQAALHSATEDLQAAILAEEEARRRREVTETSKRTALEANTAAEGGAEIAAQSREAAQRTHRSANFLLKAAEKSLKATQEEVDRAEVAEREAERALIALLSSPSDTAKPSSASTSSSAPSTHASTLNATAASYQPNSTATSGASGDGSTPRPMPAAANPQATKPISDALRQAELADSIRKMKNIRLAEEQDTARRLSQEMNATAHQRQAEADAAAAAARVKIQKEEQERRAHEDRLRHEREEREKFERAQREERLRQKRWMDATATQIIRCSQRDVEKWPMTKPWTPHDALDRFIHVSTEFDDCQYSLDLPLVVASIPWPILMSPYRVDRLHPLKLVQWQAVEDFFMAVGPMMTVVQFGTLLEKSQKRFHPDRWRSRRLLTTVMNDELRETLEATGMIVSQAINHLVSEWKTRQVI